MIAFCSACRPRQSSCLSPDGTFNFSRRHPVISQCVIPVGVPLYPVVRILLFFTIKAPTARLRQVERSEISFAIPMKYSSQSGRLLFTAAFLAILYLAQKVAIQRKFRDQGADFLFYLKNSRIV